MYEEQISGIFSLRCVSASTASSSDFPSEGRVHLSKSSGYIIHGSSFSSEIGSMGSETCPWYIIAKAGQRLTLKIIVLSDEDSKPANHEDAILCSALFMVI